MSAKAQGLMIGLVCVALAIGAGTVQATSIVLENPGFEIQPTIPADGSGIDGAMPGWTLVRTDLNPPAAGVHNPSAAQIAGEAHSGTCVAFANEQGWGGSEVRQVTSATWQPNTTYTLSMFVARRNDIDVNWGDGTPGRTELQLRDATSDTVVASLGYDLGGTGQWFPVTLQMTTPAVADYLGHDLAVQFRTRSSSIQLVYDDFSLTAVPEPMTIGMLLVGGLFGLIRRRK